MSITPGPWVTVEHPTSIAIRGPDNLNVASIAVGYQKLESLMIGHRANAQAIAAVPAMIEALKIADQLAIIASDWNLSEVEIDGEMRSIYDVRGVFTEALKQAGIEP